jgi:predicted ATP-dependent endonuclease of OLD family
MLDAIEKGELAPDDAPYGVNIQLMPTDATYIKFDVIRSFDRPLLHSDLLEKLSDSRVKTELDWQIYRLQKRFLDYQVNIGNRIIELLTTGTPEDQQKAAEVSAPKKQFQDMIDGLFADTGKKIDRKSNEIQFIQTQNQNTQIITPYQLSSGEKQILAILLTVLVENREPYALLMDEPEISLHIDLQQRLIDLIRQLNPHAQIILSTHSPALIMDGWMSNVTEVGEISN